MFLLGFRRKLTALAVCKSIESAIQWFQIHHRITFVTMQNSAYTFRVQGLAFFRPWFPDYMEEWQRQTQIHKRSTALEWTVGILPEG